MREQLAYCKFLLQDGRHVYQYSRRPDEEIFFWEKGKLMLPQEIRRGEETFLLPAATPYLNVHFEPWNLPEAERGTLAEKRFFLLQGTYEYLHFLLSWNGDQSRNDISLLIGKTNKKMAQFAVKQAGFRYADKEATGGFAIIAKRGLYPPVNGTVIYGMREELLANTGETAQALYQLLLVERQYLLSHADSEDQQLRLLAINEMLHVFD